MLPVEGRGPFPEYLTNQPANIRRIELAQRYYASQQSIEPSDVEDMLYGKWLDPLLGCLAGYSLVRAGQQERYKGSAMHNMLKFFDALPDSHVLAGLCEPDRRGEHYERALSRGLPIFAEGLRAMVDWYLQRAAGLPPNLVEPAQRLLPGSPWTAWTIAAI
jgi:hypothetical protein